MRALHGDMTLEDQRQAILPGPRRKIVLATNVAESSITIEGVRAVVDSGLARVAHHSAWSGLSRLAVERVSQASATQRAGRAEQAVHRTGHPPLSPEPTSTCAPPSTCPGADALGSVGDRLGALLAARP